ncbi:MAG: TIR domain-containing protein [Bacteroidales bacterium]|nr:TIR domain-containing protein [Bacteroidales bacterium]
MRRLPIYILINTSSSLCNGTLQNFKDSINLLIETLKDDPYALKTVYVSIITFDSTITCLCSLSPLTSFKMPSIKIGKQESSLGHTLLQLTTIIDNELIKNTYEQKGDWKPLIFIFTANDSVIDITEEVEELICHKCGRIIICTRTDSVNLGKYKKITEVILPIESLDKHIINSQFYWISESINTCERVNPYNSDLELPPPPNSIYIDIDSNYSGQIFTYESVYPYTTSSDEANIKELNTAYEKIITCLTQQQEQLKSVYSQIEALKKKKNKIESQKDATSEPRNPIAGVAGAILGGPLGAIIGGITGIFAGSTIKSSNDASERDREIVLECEKELEAKMAQALMCKKQIEDFIQQKNNLEKELAVLKEQNKYNEVYSSIFAPAEVKRKSHLQVQVYLHLYEESEIVKSLAQESDKNAERRDYIPLSLKLKKGDKVDVEFNVYGETRLTSNRKSIVWQGAFTKCSFDYFVPKDIDVEELSCVALLSVNGVPIGEMRFITRVIETPRQLNPEIIAHKYSKVFISYSHQDESKVKFLHEGLELGSVPHFFDRKYLKAGDVFPQVIQDYINSADLFILCWSENASKSEYVQKERLQALERAFPQVQPENAAKLRIYPMNIEPRAELPSDMKNYYHFGEI